MAKGRKEEEDYDFILNISSGEENEYQEVSIRDEGHSILNFDQEKKDQSSSKDKEKLKTTKWKTQKKISFSPKRYKFSPSRYKWHHDEKRFRKESFSPKRDERRFRRESFSPKRNGEGVKTDRHRSRTVKTRKKFPQPSVAEKGEKAKPQPPIDRKEYIKTPNVQRFKPMTPIEAYICPICQQRIEADLEILKEHLLRCHSKPIREIADDKVKESVKLTSPQRSQHEEDEDLKKFIEKKKIRKNQMAILSHIGSVVQDSNEPLSLGEIKIIRARYEVNGTKVSRIEGYTPPLPMESSMKKFRVSNMGSYYITQEFCNYLFRYSKKIYYLFKDNLNEFDFLQLEDAGVRYFKYFCIAMSSLHSAVWAEEQHIPNFNSTPDICNFGNPSAYRDSMQFIIHPDILSPVEISEWFDQFKRINLKRKSKRKSKKERNLNGIKQQVLELKIIANDLLSVNI